MAIERKKVGIIGTGNVGATLAFYLVTEHLCDDLVLIDRNEKEGRGRNAGPATLHGLFREQYRG